jgi:phage repressor protein C with HTH and peptisase S24 domain
MEAKMKFKDRFFQLLKQRSQERGWQSAFAEQAGIRQSSLSQIINGTTKSPSLDNVGAIVDALGVENFYGPGGEKNISSAKDTLPAVPLMGETGAGAPQELYGTADTVIRILPQFYRNDMVALTVRGNSMEPTIKDGAIVGIAPLSEDVTEGGIYLVSIPYFGRVVKRLKLSEDGDLLLCSDNPKYKPVRVNPAEQEKTVLGQVVWVLQTV